ncbi:hypothetical protein KC332_g6036 [Hortaea werneckii]|nr:hypothetical protein KC358_g8828 [Hortaea werneckii]KAI6842329.1 hypothetical protein KC350_g5092 [Hortaea werneckii]KAI6935935.1 hypothetical protein KC348_g6134 [Hortaea werneckii]KAI6937297.1 hypothetical protein KC341_g5672 [Hortaea werneckii]KAI6967400.1 hypothetical protein KC321_g9041 [Hortaea werneckii]
MRLTILLMPAMPPGGATSTDSQKALWKCLFAGSEDDTLQDVWKRTERKLEKRGQSSRDNPALSNFRFGHLSDKNGAEYDLEDTLGSLFGQQEEETLFAQQPAVNFPLKRPASPQHFDETPRKKQKKEPDWELTDAGKEWTPEEDEDLICGKEEGLSCPAICRKYGIKRPDSSLRNRWRSVLSKRDEVRERLKMPPLRWKRKARSPRVVQESQQEQEISEARVSARNNGGIGSDSNVPHESAHENATPNLNEDSLKGQTKDTERERNHGDEPESHVFIQATPEDDDDRASTTEAQNDSSSKKTNSQRTQRTVAHVAIPGPSKRPSLGEGRTRQSQLPFTPVTSRQPSRPSSHATKDGADHAFPTPPDATPNEYDNTIERSETQAVPSSGAEYQDGTHMSSEEGVDVDLTTGARAALSGDEMVKEDNAVSEHQKAQATDRVTDDEHDPFEDFQRLASEAETPRPPTTGRLRRPTASLRRRRRRVSSPIAQREIANHQSPIQIPERVEELGPPRNLELEDTNRETATPIPQQEPPPEESELHDEHPAPTPIIIATQYSQTQLSRQRQLEMMGVDDPDYELKKSDDQVMTEARIKYPDDEQQMMRDYCRKINWRDISRLVHLAGEYEGDEEKQAEIIARIKALNEEMARNQETWDIEDGKRPRRKKMQRLQHADGDDEESADEELERDEPQTERVREGIPGSIWSDIEDENFSEDEGSVMAGFEVFGGGETDGYDVLGFGEDRRPFAIDDGNDETEELTHFQSQGDNGLPQDHEDNSESDAGEGKAIQDEMSPGAHEIAQHDDSVVPQAIKIEDWQPENDNTVREELSLDGAVQGADQDSELPLNRTPVPSRRLRSPFEENRMAEEDVRDACLSDSEALHQPQAPAPEEEYEFNAHISPADRLESEADLPEYPPWYSAVHVDQEDAQAGAVSISKAENEQDLLSPSNILSSSAKPHKSKSAEKKARYRQKLAVRKRRQQLNQETLPTSELSIEESEMRRNQKAQRRKERKLEKKRRRQKARGLSSDAGIAAF